METIREEDQRTSNTASESMLVPPAGRYLCCLIRFMRVCSKQGKAAYLGLEERYSELIEREETWREQCRQREVSSLGATPSSLPLTNNCVHPQFCTKRKGYKNLLTMLKAEKWSDSLRSYD